MSKDQELPAVDLREYAAMIRQTFEIYDVKDEAIDYPEIELLPTEIARRRALLKYFIPDVFAPGKYDHRADVIDGVIYYMEIYITKGGNYGTIHRYWAKRAGVRKIYQESEYEEDHYGYFHYHPIEYVLGTNNGASIPQLVERIRAFRGRKRKLDMKDLLLVFSSTYLWTETEITENMVRAIQEINQWIEKNSILDKIRWRDIIESSPALSQIPSFPKKGGALKALNAKLNTIIVGILPQYERSAFGLENFWFFCPYPHHVRAKFRKGELTQQFRTAGRQFIQQINTVIPTGQRWDRLYRKFPPQTECYRLIRLRVPHHAILDYFDPAIQDWVIPWNTILKEWCRYANSIDQTDIPFQPNYHDLDPTEELLRVCYLLEMDAQTRNKRIARVAKISEERVRELRQQLDTGALAMRLLLIYQKEFANMIYTYILIPGNEIWKYNLLLKIGEVVPYSGLFSMEDVLNSKPYFMGTYAHTPKHSLNFIKIFTQAFHGTIDYSIWNQMVTGRLTRSWFDDLFDPEIETWNWDANDYAIIPLPPKIH